MPWPYQFQGGSQPYAAKRLPPSVIAVPEDNPPFRHPGRTPQQNAVAVQPWQPEAWPYAYMGNGQPYMSPRINPATASVTVDNPPFDMRFAANEAGILAAWRPDPWPAVFMGGLQSYQPRTLPPSILAVPEDNPPFRHPGRWAGTEVQQRGYQPEVWPYTFTGGRQPYTPSRLPPTVTDVQVDNPPFRHAGRSPQPEIAQRGYQPEIWPYSFDGGPQPYAQRKLVSSIHSIPVNNPPFTHPERLPSYMALNTPWQPEIWTYAFAGGWQPYGPRKLAPDISAVPENNPPFGIPNWQTLSSIDVQWQPEAWPSVFMGGKQAYEPRKLSPAIPGQSIDEPPYTHRGRTPTTASIIVPWQPDPWTYAFLGGRGPFIGLKMAPGTPGASVDNPPFRMAGRLPQTVSTQWQWQPPAWPFVFMGGHQPYQRGNLPPVVTNVPIPVNYRLVIRNQIVRLDNVIRGQGNTTNFNGGA